MLPVGQTSWQASAGFIPFTDKDPEAHTREDLPTARAQTPGSRAGDGVSAGPSSGSARKPLHFFAAHRWPRPPFSASRAKEPQS